MLPILMYNNMEGGSNSLNNTPNSSFSQYDDNIILNCVRNRKKVTELPSCPVCSCTIRQGELDSHLALEVERLQKLSSCGSKRKLSVNSSANLAVAGSSTSVEVPEEEVEVDVSGCLGSDVYQRVHSNRLRRLRARRRSSPTPQSGECPVCNARLPVCRLQRHALRCLKRTGAALDEDVPDTSSEDESIDVEVVDGDEDTELYGPPQYSPSRIAPDADLTPVTTETEEEPIDTQNEVENKTPEPASKCNGLVEASAETRIQALKARIKDLERKANGAGEMKCLICLEQYTSPTVSIQCWHVYCEVCWLQSLRAKKICPQCNAITTAQHLRRIYM
ncbi:E3 ubiquitin-protein ligase RNF220 isoform X2 [Helicoverpa zea]|uniref:E3 ubiquitin-protein ligase RNF220 isoform X2 n=1 Tax=Helicoverpa zea TaxID=7113 RepID=UPI001F55E53C|nr:E3 ubiquitin-protein ligase RNF220 isoform X2 [Helicoverpa zea]